MDKPLAAFVRERAGNACEYCQLPAAYSSSPFQIDHIVAIKHGGDDAHGNLALACFACNQHTGPNIAGVDPSKGSLQRLYHPRRHKWSRHFAWRGPLLAGRTAIGRVTIAVLAINLPHRVLLRQMLIEEGVFPPRS